MKARVVVAVEGVLSDDGRLIRPGATTWGDGPIPVVSFDGTTIGYVHDLEREDNLIVGTLVLWRTNESPSLGATLDSTETEFNDEEGALVFTKGMLRGLTLQSSVAAVWPETVIP